MAQKETRPRLASGAGLDSLKGELKPANYPNWQCGATAFAAHWIARRYHLPLSAARIIAALAGIGERCA